MTEVVRRRLRAQGVAGRGFSSVAEAASGLLALQAQDLLAAKWALALRSTGSLADVDAALESGAVVRSWPMRGTLMIAARDDLRWLTELLAPRSFAASAGVWRQAELVERDFDVARDAAREALAGGASLSRADLLTAFERAGVATGRGRGSHLIRRIAGDAVVCFGPPRGAEQTFVLLDEWAPGHSEPDRDAALAELARRYSGGHAPATVRDLAWWSGLTLTEARRAASLGGVAIDGGDLEPPGGTAAPVRRGDVRLLGAFDEFLLGYADRTASLRPEHFARVVPYSNGLFSPVLTVDGEVVGTWRRALGGASAVRVEVVPFEPLAPAVVAGVERRAAQYARYLGRELDLVVDLA